ncbi:unnamed protein product [Sympodiomycopsis kandeliae]
MSRTELLNPSLLRIDGRRPYEFRSLEIHFDPSSSNLASSSSRPDGSIRFIQGLNDVTCHVFGPRETSGNSGTSNASNAISTGGIGKEGANLDVQVWMQSSASAGGDRRVRGRGDRRIQELQTTLIQAFDPIISTHLYPRNSTITLSLSITSSDGSLLPTLINASTLALLNAGISLSDYLISTSISFHPSTSITTSEKGSILLLDPSSSEELDLPTLSLAVTPRDGKLVLSLLDAGRGKVEQDDIEKAWKAGKEALSGVFMKELEVATRHWARKLNSVQG